MSKIFVLTFLAWVLLLIPLSKAGAKGKPSAHPTPPAHLFPPKAQPRVLRHDAKPEATPFPTPIPKADRKPKPTPRGNKK